MKIGFDHQAFALQSYGGVSRYIVRLATELYQGRHKQDVRVIAPLHRNRYVGELPTGVFKGFELEKFPPRSGRVIAGFNRVAAGKAFGRWKPDLIHETYYAFKPLPRSSAASVITVHDMTHERFPESFSRFDASAQMKRAAVARADHIICISESTKRDLIELLGTPENKISIVYHGFDLLPSNGPVASAACEQPYLFYVGSRAAYKNFANLLKAFAASAQLKKDFRIIAFGGGALSGEEKSLISRLGLAEDRVLVVQGDDASLGAYYAGARAFIYPSRYEGFGLPPLEAMANNCPVITSNSSSLPEVVGDAGVYFNPDNVEQMRAAIEDTVYSEATLATLKVRGRERLAHFSWSKCADDTMNVYRQTLGEDIVQPRTATSGN
jgi:glycosyltransferase involved in cell wall biosynthesis